MGYTHYWEGSTKCTEQAWASAIDDIQRVVAVAGIPLAGGLAEEGTQPKFNKDEIWLNGVGDDSRETFHVEHNEEIEFDFCKTAQNPYDLVVCACLIILKRWIPTLEISSDGDEEELGWGNAISLCQSVLGYGNYPCGEGARVVVPSEMTRENFDRAMADIKPPTDEEMNSPVTIKRYVPTEE